MRAINFISKAISSISVIVVGLSVRPNPSSACSAGGIVLAGPWLHGLTTTENPNLLHATVASKEPCTPSWDLLNVTIQMDSGSVVGGHSQNKEIAVPEPAQDPKRGYIVNIDWPNVTLIGPDGFNVTSFTFINPDAEEPVESHEELRSFYHRYTSFFVGTDKAYILYQVEEEFGVAAAIVELHEPYKVEFSWVRSPSSSGKLRALAPLAAVYNDLNLAVFKSGGADCTRELFAYFNERRVRVVYVTSDIPPLLSDDVTNLNPTGYYSILDTLNRGMNPTRFMVLQQYSELYDNPRQPKEKCKLAYRDGETLPVNRVHRYSILDMSLFTGEVLGRYSLNFDDIQSIGSSCSKKMMLTAS